MVDSPGWPIAAEGTTNLPPAQASAVMGAGNGPLEQDLGNWLRSGGVVGHCACLGKPPSGDRVPEERSQCSCVCHWPGVSLGSTCEFGGLAWL